VWKISNVVVPIPKVNSSNYRPISTFTVLANAFENVMFEQMADNVTGNHLVSPFKSGFRPGHSTMTALVRVSGDFCMNSILVLFDFSKAFDSVFHGLFVLKLFVNIMAFILFILALVTILYFSSASKDRL
jgi:hypothetical protein